MAKCRFKFLVCTQTDVDYEGYLMRFLEVIRGALIAAPKRLLPVMYMPLFGPDQMKNVT
jgi:hypothetical protein